MEARAHRLILVLLAVLIAGGVTVAQVGRGWSDWPTSYADAQRTSWLRTDQKISIESMSRPGFDLQWTSRLENQRRGLQGFTQGVTASGVTLFVPASIVAGSSNNLFMLDNDTGHMIWSRTFEGPLPAAGVPDARTMRVGVESTAPCTGGITAAPTRIVNAMAEPTAPPAAATAPPPAGGNQQGYRSSLGKPGQGIPVEPRAPRPGGAPGGAGGPGRGAPGPGGRPQAPRIPGAPDLGGGGLGRAMVAYAVAGDGQLHVVGLQSGKDLQKPAPFLPANAQWSNPVAVGTMMYAATSGNCAGAPNGVYAIDLDAADKPVVSYRTNGGSVVGSVAFSSDGDTLLASIGPGSVTADGKANAIVALDPRTLKLKDWFTQPTAEFVTGPTVFRHGAKDVVAAATKDGRVILLDVASLGGANHATPLMTSPSLVASGGSIAAEALATWARVAASSRGPEERWILVPLSGRIVALRVAEERGVFTLKPEWTSNDLITPATPIIVNGVVFTLSTGRPAAGGGKRSPAVLYAYDGVSGKALWNSGKSMATFASPGSYWSALSQVYVGTDDGTVYAFGFLDERR
jgi:outer membrane protein assembly factor BamB